MSEEDDIVLDAIAGRRVNGQGKVRGNCPFCETVVGKTDRRQCLAVNMSSGYWKCFRCETWGKLDEIPHDIATLTKKATETRLEPTNLPKGFIPLWTDDSLTSIALEPARKYLYKIRGVPFEIAKSANIGACLTGEFRGRVVIPIYKSGALAGYVGRIWRRKGDFTYRYNTGFERAVTIYNEEAIYKKTTKPLIVVEGVFDTYPFWPHGCALLGKTSPQQFDMLCGARRPVCIAFDGDAWREGEALAMALTRYGTPAFSLRLPPTVDPDEIPDWILEQARAHAATG
jgi:hypothetical protein